MHKCRECGNTFINAESFNAHRSSIRKLHIVPLGSRPAATERKWYMNYEGRGGTGVVTVAWLHGACIFGDKFEAYGGMLGLKSLRQDAAA